MGASLKLCSHRFIVDCLSWELARCRRYRGITSVLLVGLDLHADTSPATVSWCMGQTGKLVKRAIREADMAGEHAKSEFLVLLPETPRNGALVAAERLRYAVERGALPTDTGRPPVTVSIGVVGYPEDGDTVALILAAAKGALAEARARGGNRVQLTRSLVPAVGVESAPRS